MPESTEATLLESTDIAPEGLVQGRAAYTADILALSRATIETMHRALRSAPEVRENRVMSRWPIDLEDVLFELEPTCAETSISELAARLGVSTAQLRSTALRLQRMSLVRVSTEGVGLTPQGRQKLARLEAARASVLRRIASGMEAPLSEDEAQQVIRFLHVLLARAEEVLETQLGQADPPRRPL